MEYTDVAPHGNTVQATMNCSPDAMSAVTTASLSEYDLAVRMRTESDGLTRFARAHVKAYADTSESSTATMNLLFVSDMSTSELILRGEK